MLRKMPLITTDGALKLDQLEEDCEHIWHYIEDWEGDPTLHNGTNDLSHWECQECGATKHKSFNPYPE